MCNNMSLLENIFSVKNSDLNHKQICFLGFKIKWHKEAKPRYAYEDLPIENNKIIFRTYYGAYSCNPKYIAEEIIRQNLPYKLVWVVNKNILKFIDDFPRDKIMLVMSGSPEDFRETLTAKIIIENERRAKYIKKGVFKRSQQIYISTWHGSLGIKKTGQDREDLTEKNFRISKIDSSQIDYMTSNGSYTTEFFKRNFWNNGKILECGHPRNDVFFKNTEGVRKKIFYKYNISEDKKILLYAPTFRQDYDLTAYNIDFLSLKKTLIKHFGGDWVIFYRLHPELLKLKEKFEFDSINTIDVSDYSDMQELLVAADSIITDYSSCIYDFMLSYKPGFIFATDRKKYENSRGLYYSLSSTPFPVAESNDELIKNIENFDYEKYKKEVKEFLKDKGCIDDGHASERVVELIKSIINDDVKNDD